MFRKNLVVSTALSAAALVVALDATPAAALDRMAGIGFAASAATPVQLVAYDPLVYRAQLALTRQGFDVGAPDGVMGPRTRAGIEAYQRAQGLPVTGYLTESLVAQIEGPQSARAERRQERREARQERRSEADLISQIQAELRRQGYDITIVGGRLNGETQDAIRAYERGHGMPVTGMPSEELLASLRGAGAVYGERADTGPQEGREYWRVSSVERALNDLGYRAGAVDGRIDRSLRSAIRTYQADRGLAVTGRISDDLMASLGLAAAESGEVVGVVRPSSPRYLARISDDFSDGDYTRNPNWRVLAGAFQVNGGVLQSSVPVVVSQAQPFGRALVQGAFEQALGISPAGPAGTAAIATTRAVDDAFRVSISLAGNGPQGATIDVGPYQGGDAASGYRLLYDGDASRPLKLMLARQGSASTIATSATNANLYDGRMHVIEWTREADGNMQVTVDGTPTMVVRDVAFGGGDFDGFSIINRGGGWSVDHVTVQNLAP